MVSHTQCGEEDATVLTWTGQAGENWLVRLIGMARSLYSDSRPRDRGWHCNMAAASQEEVSTKEQISRLKASKLCLVSLEMDTVNVWDFQNHDWLNSRLPSSLDLDVYGRYLWVEGGLFCSGGTHSLGFLSKRAMRVAYLLGQDWTVTQLADMITPRCDHGLWWLSSRQSVLVFGGMLYIGANQGPT